jgi:prepilin-type N-terminal cleavage/methylation domain-containing protein
MKARRGVTLMELIVALTVTGFMAAIGTATFSSIIDNRRIIRESTAETEKAAALRETLRAWLLPATVQVQIGGIPRGSRQSNVRAVSTNATTRTPNGAEAVAPAAVTGDELVFTTTAPNPANAPNARMRLFIDLDEETPEQGLTLEYQVNVQSPLQRRQLDSTVTGMVIEYLDRRTRRWISATDATALQPMALRLTLAAAEGTIAPTLMSLPMVVTINQSAVNAPPRTPAR